MAFTNFGKPSLAFNTYSKFCEDFKNLYNESYKQSSNEPIQKLYSIPQPLHQC